MAFVMNHCAEQIQSCCWTIPLAFWSAKTTSPGLSLSSVLNENDALLDRKCPCDTAWIWRRARCSTKTTGSDLSSSSVVNQMLFCLTKCARVIRPYWKFVGKAEMTLSRDWQHHSRLSWARATHSMRIISPTVRKPELLHSYFMFLL